MNLAYSKQTNDLSSDNQKCDVKKQSSRLIVKIWESKIMTIDASSTSEKWEV